MILKIKQSIGKHKKALIILLAIAGGYYYWQSSHAATAQVTKYTLGNVEKGTIITSVSGTGQVSPSNQVEVKPKVQADILAVKVKAGQKVKKGDLLALLDDKDLRIEANKSRDSLAITQANLQLKLAGVTSEDIALAKNSVESAKNSYNIAVKNLASTQQTVQQSLAKAQLSLTSAQNQYNNTVSSQDLNTTTDSIALVNAYKSTGVSINSAYVSLRSGIAFADGILNTQQAGLKNVLGVLNSSSLNEANGSLLSTKERIKDFETSLNALGASPTHDQLEAALSKELLLAQDVRQLEHAVYVVLLNTITTSDLSQASLDSNRSNASSQESSMNSVVGNLQNAQQTIANAKLGIDSGSLSANSSLDNATNSLQSAQSSFTQAKLDAQKTLDSANNDVVAKKNSLDNAQIQYNQKIAPPRAVDLLSLRVQVTQAQANYTQALDNLASAKVVSPIDGVVAQVTANVGDQTSISVSTPLATVITDKQIAIISFNEVDAAKIEAGQQANLTFSALGDLSVTGEVSSVDLIGVTSQGVVSYSVQIALDAQNKLIKPQMSVTASIITNKKLDTLLLPNSAIKTDSSGASYVELFQKDAVLAKQADGTYTAIVEPSQQPIAVGLVNDANSEILSGLNNNDQVIIKTTTTGTAAKTTTQTSGLGILGGGGSRSGGLAR